MFRPDIDPKVIFVGMSFAAEDRLRWSTIIEPGIREAGYQPYRVDFRLAGDSVLVDIMQGIITAKLLVFDLQVATQHSKIDPYRFLPL